MAEVIGVVSGALTFATVVAQATKSIFQIRDCWSQIRDAPEDLQRLVREVEIFGLILTDIEEDLSKDEVAGVLKNSNHALQSLELCKEAAVDLETVSDSLIKEIRPISGLTRTYASLKVVIKKGSIEKYRTRLGNASRLLSLSQQCYTRALIQVQPELIATRILSGKHDADLQMFQNENEAGCDTDIHTQSSHRKITRRPHKNNYLWRLALPSWLTSKCLEVTGARTPNSWRWNFQAYNIIFHSSIVHQCVRSNDVQGLQRLFSSGEASPFDRGPGEYGQTLLDIALYLSHLEVVALLLEQGAELNLFDYQKGESRLLSLVFFFNETFEDEGYMILKSLYHFRGSAKEFLFVLERFLPSFYELPQVKRNELALYYLNHSNSENWLLQRSRHDLIPQVKRNKLVLHYLNHPGRGGWLLNSTRRNLFPFSKYYVISRGASWNVTCAYLELPELLRIIFRGIVFTTCPPEFELYSDFLASYGILNLPNRISRKLGELQVYRDGVEDETHYKPMFRLFHDFLVGGLDVNQVDDDGSTLLTAFCDGIFFWGYTTKAIARRNSSLRYWLQDLQDSGVDLENFGKKQQILFKALGGPIKLGCPANSAATHSSYQKVSAYVRVIGFSHGPSPENWALWVTENSDSFAGEFWHMIERRIEMPGGWSSDVHLFL